MFSQMIQQLAEPKRRHPATTLPWQALLDHHLVCTLDIELETMRAYRHSTQATHM